MSNLHKIDTHIGSGAGLAATNAMALTGIKVGHRLLWVVSHEENGSIPNGQAVSDFTVGAGTITAGTIDLSNLWFTACWTSVAGS